MSRMKKELFIVGDLDYWLKQTEVEAIPRFAERAEELFYVSK